MQKLIVTDAGLAALINAQHSGTTPIVITQLKLGDSKWIADASATELKNVTKTFDVQYGGTLDPHTIQVAAIDQSEEQYQAYELGIFTDSGILFAVISSDSTPIIQKHGSSIIEILCNVTVKSANEGDIQVGDGTLSFITPSASETTAGIAQFATEEEVLAGEEDSKMISPATLHKKTATEERIGLVELATVAEVKTGTDSTRAVTPKALKDNYLPLTGGTVTGATTFTGALKSGSSGNLNLATKLVSGVSISGEVITFTFNDGTTQDTVTTNTSNWSISKGTNGWARDNSAGFTIQWGKIVTGSHATVQVTFPKTFITLYSVVFSVEDGNCDHLNIVQNSPTGTTVSLYSDCGGGYFHWLAVGLS